jgi:hypothetical protein
MLAESVDRNRAKPYCEVKYVPCREYKVEIIAGDGDGWPTVIVFGRQGSKENGWSEWLKLAESPGWCSEEGALEEASLILRELVRQSPFGQLWGVAS